MIFRIDPTSDVPLFAQLVTQVRLGAIKGEITPGERLPSARELAAALEVNMHTVLRAYQTLRDEGVIELRRGRGAVVADSPATRADASLQAAVDTVVREARALGVPASLVQAMLHEAW